MYEAPLARLLFAAVDMAPEIYERHGSTSPFEGGTGFHSFLPTTVSRDEASGSSPTSPAASSASTRLSGRRTRSPTRSAPIQQAGLRDVVLWNITPFADPAQSVYSFKAMKQVRELLETEPAAAG